MPRPDLIVVGTSLIGISLIVSGACDLLGKKTKEMQIEENDEKNTYMLQWKYKNVYYEVLGKISVEEMKKIAEKIMY